jgi:hypothetical protein
VVDPLLAIVNNEKISDAEKLYAFQGLRNLLEQTEILDQTVHFPELRTNPAKLGAIAQALTNYIMQKRTPRDDREKAVIEFVRRHAVEAMARFKEGVLRKPNRDLIFRTSWTLVRVMEQDPTASPPFTIQEQTEAAIGFCQMKVDPDLNLDVAAYTLAKISVNFARAANLDSQRAARDGTLPSIPWKVFAARLSYALAVWRQAAKPVGTMATTVISLLTKIEKGGPSEATGSETQAVITWATDNPPKASVEAKPVLMYKDDPQSQLPFPTTAVIKTPEAKKDPGLKGDPKKGADLKKGPMPDKK